MTQFSIHWILSLNQLCQKWGQVQLSVLAATGIGQIVGDELAQPKPLVQLSNH
jgi:hypothetical protein